MTRPTAARGHIPFKGHRTVAKMLDDCDSDRFFDELSTSGDVSRAAAKVGRSADWGEKKVRQVCRFYGEQAA